MPGTVFIGPSGLLDALKQRSDLGETLSFTGADATRALRTIRSRRPELVVIDSAFAETQHGGALIRRIQADPALATCNVRIVGHDGETVPVASPRPRARGEPAITKSRPAGPSATAPAGTAPVEQGHRRAPRFKLVEGTQVHIDDKPVTVVDMSLVGAEVLSPAPLRPNQRIRFTLPDDVHPVHLRAMVVWASFEMPRGVPSYRAGIQFFDPRKDWLSGFIEAYKLEPRAWR